MAAIRGAQQLQINHNSTSLLSATSCCWQAGQVCRTSAHSIVCQPQHDQFGMLNQCKSRWAVPKSPPSGTPMCPAGGC